MNSLVEGGRSLVSPGHQYLIVLAVALRFMMGGIDSSILPLGISSVVWDFGGDYASFLFLIEGVIFASALIFAGRLGDQIGMKRIFLAGILLFTLGSFCSSIAGSMQWLLAGRFVTATGLTLSLAVSLPIIMIYISEERRGRSIGYTVMGMGLGSVIGPVICGMILQDLGWAPMFLVLIPPGVFILIIGYIAIPDSPPRSAQMRYDAPGFILTFLTLGLFCIGMNLGLLEHNPVFFLQTLVISLISAFLLIRWEKKTDHPLIDFSFMTKRIILIPLIITFCLYCIYRISLYFLPVYLSEILNISPFMSGIIMSAGALVAAAGGPFSGFYMEKYGISGMRLLLILSAVFAIFSSIGMLLSPVIGVMNAVFFSLLMLGIMFALGWTTIYGYYYSLVPLQYIGTAGGIIETVTEFSALMAVSFVQIFFSAGIRVGSGGAVSVRDILDGVMPGIQGVYLFCLFLSTLLLFLSLTLRIHPSRF